MLKSANKSADNFQHIISMDIMDFESGRHIDLLTPVFSALFSMDFQHF